MRAALIAIVLGGCACAAGSGEDCAALGTQARAFSNSRLDQFGGGCSTDVDCALLRANLSCYAGCERAVRLSLAQSAQRDLDSLSSTLCGSSACLVTEGCNAVHAECVLGVCRTVPGARDAGTPDAGISDAG